MAVNIQVPVLCPAVHFQDTDGNPIRQITISKTLTAATNNQTVYTGTTGKRIRVLEIAAYSTGASSEIIFKDGAAGTVLRSCLLPLAAGEHPNYMTGYNSFGFLETSAGNDLVVDCGAVSVKINVRLIIYPEAN